MTPIDNSPASQHSMHVYGIIGAEHNNIDSLIIKNGPPGSLSNGFVAGGCINCSLVPYPFDVASQEGTVAAIAQRLNEAIDSGMQIVNYSGGMPDKNCSSATIICDVLLYATRRFVLIVVASGNSRNAAATIPLVVSAPVAGPQFPGNQSGIYSVLPVGGTAPDGSRWDSALPAAWPYCTSIFSCELGSNEASTSGVVAPAKSIISTFRPGYHYVTAYPSLCADNHTTDESRFRYLNGAGDGVGSCTGTSMAAPHVAALAAMIRSINPRASADIIRDIIRTSADNTASPNDIYGHGTPNATTAMTLALSTNPSRLTPLFSYFGTYRMDSFYTTVPQMARAAAEGLLQPRTANYTDYFHQYTPTYGYTVAGWWLPPGSPFVFGPSAPIYTKAEVWVFTTHTNPKSSTVPLEALYRMSWKCGDYTPYPPTICTAATDEYTGKAHIDTVLVMGSEIQAFKTLGYKLDGLEGYIYPRSEPQPPGTVRLLRRYNATLDDNAIFPESSLATMTSLGYTSISNGVDWLGYAYPNPPAGTMPVVQ
ncbi:MAG: S8 family serine peptidase [Rubrivivax sp.]